MTNDTLFNAAWSLLAIMAIAYIVFWRYRAYKLDAFRQDIFDLRDALFDEAQEGLISFNHPAYGMLREFMNGFIRFGHQLSLWQILIFLFLARKEDFATKSSFEEKWKKVTSDLMPSVKEQLDSYRLKAHFAIFKHLIATAPGLILTIVVPLLLLLFMKIIVERLKNFTNPPIDSAALTLGQA
ncbi:MAG: hypothetical protein PHQ35_04410 [Phycisphaerae bacterium]|nr:hypothetical protein [Phycisphaerae bacterium]MDD5380238.1 hypothetical protein [Phycisphaerae bacterium]